MYVTATVIWHSYVQTIFLGLTSEQRLREGWQEVAEQWLQLHCGTEGDA